MRDIDFESPSVQSHLSILQAIIGRMAASCDPQFLTVFPKATEQQGHRFKLLKRAYTEARYNQGYKITKEELEYLAKRVRKLLRLTKKICKAKIESFI